MSSGHVYIHTYIYIYSAGHLLRTCFPKCLGNFVLTAYLGTGKLLRTKVRSFVLSKVHLEQNVYSKYEISVLSV